MKEKLLIIRAGGHAKSCADVIEAENKFEIMGFVDSSVKQTNLLGYPIFGDDVKKFLHYFRILRDNFECLIIKIGVDKEHFIKRVLLGKSYAKR